MQGPPACGNVPTLTYIYPIYGSLRRGEGTSVLFWLTILLGDVQHGTKNTSELVHFREQTSQPTSCRRASNPAQ